MNNLILPSSFWLRAARRGGEIWAKFPFEYDELLVHVSNKIKLLDICIKRNSTFLGRIFNKITGEEVDVIILDGIVVKQLFDIIGEDPPMLIKLSASYRVDHEDMRKWYALAEDAKPTAQSDDTPQSTKSTPQST